MLSSEGETPFKKAKLIAEIEKLDLPEEKQQKIQVQEIAQVQEKSTGNFFKNWPKESNKDDIELSLWLKASRLLKEIADMHSQLTLLPTDEERGRMAFALLDKDDELDKVYEQRDYYQTHGRLPNDQEIEYITDPKAIAKRLVALQRYIRREKQNLKDNPANTEAAARLARWEQEYKHYTND
jgi:hypothetical protein